MPRRCPKQAETADLRRQADAAAAKATRNDPGLAAVLLNAAGHVVFPAIGRDAESGRDTHAKGVLYEYGTVVGEINTRQASSSLRQGGQAYTEIIVFKTEEAVYAFKNGDFTFDSLATGTAMKSGAAANAAYTRDVAVFTVDTSGERYEASIGAQKFSYVAQFPVMEAPSGTLVAVSDP